jgi:hypothetical protein
VLQGFPDNSLRSRLCAESLLSWTFVLLQSLTWKRPAAEQPHRARTTDWYRLLPTELTEANLANSARYPDDTGTYRSPRIHLARSFWRQTRSIDPAEAASLFQETVRKDQDLPRRDTESASLPPRTVFPRRCRILRRGPGASVSSRSGV